MQKTGKEQQKKNTNKQKEKRMRKYRIIKFLLKVIVCIALLVGLIVYAFTSPLFNITEIVVNGDEKFDDDTYIALSGLSIDDNIFNFSKSTVISNIKQNAYVESVKIKRKLPSTIEITVEERTVTFMVELENDKVAYINNQGYVLEISEELLDLTIITGISTETENIIEGNRLCTEDLEKLQDVIKITDAIKNMEVSAELSTIDVTDSSDYILIFEKEVKTVHLGDTNDLATKIAYMKSLMEEYESGVPGTIYWNKTLMYFSPE